MICPACGQSYDIISDGAVVACHDCGHEWSLVAGVDYEPSEPRFCEVPGCADEVVALLADSTMVCRRHKDDPMLALADLLASTMPDEDDEDECENGLDRKLGFTNSAG